MKRSMFLVVVLAIFAMFCVSCAGGNYRAKRPCSTLHVVSPILIDPYSVVTVTVDYSRSLDDMIKAGRYGQVVGSIDDVHFPLKKDSRTHETVRQVKLALVDTDAAMDTDSLLEAMEETRVRPAKIEELLAFGEAYPDKQKNYQIVGYGSVGRYPYGDRLVPFLGYFWDSRYVGLLPYDYGWHRYARYLVVIEE